MENVTSIFKVRSLIPGTWRYGVLLECLRKALKMAPLKVQKIFQQIDVLNFLETTFRS